MCSDASSHSVRATVAFYFNGGISMDEADWEFINEESIQRLLTSINMLPFVVFFQICWQCPNIPTPPWRTGG